MQKGLGLRVSATGSRTFVCLIASGRRKALGRYPVLRLADARKAVKTIIAEITLGKIHPLNTAFEDVVTAFLEASERENKPRTTADYRRLLNRHFRYGRKSITDIPPQDILRRINALSDTPSEKHHAFTAARALFRFAVKNHYLDRSPMEYMDTPPAGKSRDRVLTADEIAAVYKAARETPFPFGPMVQLLILTGQRRGEIAALRWEWINEDRIDFPAEIAKNGRAWTIPIGKTVQAIIKDIPAGSTYLFPATRQHVRGKPTTSYNGFTKDTPALRTRAGIEHFTLHDFRRTFSSQMAALGVPQVVVEKLLNHVSGGTLSPIAQVYNRHTYMPEMRDALIRWEDRLHSFCQ
jgi:integrase